MVRWENAVSRIGNLHVISAGIINSRQPIRTTQVLGVADFARQNYNTVCLDLPGAMDSLSMESIRLSDRAFLVCTPEVASIRMAQRALDHLRSASLADRVRLIVNRTVPNATNNRYKIEEELQCEVAATIPNDYEAVQRGLTLGHAVIRDGEMAARFSSLAASLAGTAAAVEQWRVSSRQSEKRGFLGRLFR
jgi:Flp pilus assembly CpaE family ATPase